MNNIDIIIRYVKEQNRTTFSKEWVLWLLSLLDGMDNAAINPAWLRATHKFTDDPEPPM